jgi:hypothetical protein
MSSATGWISWDKFFFFIRTSLLILVFDLQRQGLYIWECSIKGKSRANEETGFEMAYPTEIEAPTIDLSDDMHLS